MIDSRLQSALEMRPRRATASETHLGAEVVALDKTPLALLTWHTAFNRHAVAYSQVHVGANSNHLARGFVAETKRLPDLDGAIAAVLVIVNVGAAERCSSHCNLNLICEWCWQRSGLRSKVSRSNQVLAE
jgi:hypothetical protein